MLKEKQNLLLSGATSQELGPCMKSFGTAVNTLLTQFRRMEGVIFGGRQRAFVVARFTQQWS